MIKGIIEGAAGAAGGILGGLGKNRSLKRQISAARAQQADNLDWFDRRYNEDALQRADAQAAVRDAAERMRKSSRAASGMAAVMGGTEEGVAAAKAAGAEAMADAASQIAVAGANRKDSIENRYLERKNELQDRIDTLNGQKQSALDIANGAIGGAVDGFSKGMGMG